MASYRKLPSGKWQAEVVTPLRDARGRNKRVYRADRLKGVVQEWATSLEAAISAGTWLDPKASATTLAEYRETWRRHKIADGSTLDKVDSHWRNHLQQRWGGYPLGLIGRPELKAWVKQLADEQCPRCRQAPGVARGVLVKHKRPARSGDVACAGAGEDPGLGAWTIQGVVSHLSGLLTAAVDDGLIPANPATKLELPPARPKPIFFWTRDEAAKILLELGGVDALLVDLVMHVGLRPGEVFGLRAGFVDTGVWQLHVHWTMTRNGLRPWAKSSMSHRPVPIPRHLRPQIADLVDSLGPDDLLFPAPGGGPWNDRNYAQRVFVPAVERAGVRSGTPYDMRHTAASWLVQRGVDLKRVQELLGHEKYSTTLRYSHLKPGAFEEIEDAWGDDPLDPRAAAPSVRGPYDAPQKAKDPGLA